MARCCRTPAKKLAAARVNAIVAKEWRKGRRRGRRRRRRPTNEQAERKRQWWQGPSVKSYRYCDEDDGNDDDDAAAAAAVAADETRNQKWKRERGEKLRTQSSEKREKKWWDKNRIILKNSAVANLTRSSFGSGGGDGCTALTSFIDEQKNAVLSIDKLATGTLGACSS